MAFPDDPPLPPKPDDYFRFGPFEMARFGKLTVMQNNQSPEEHAEYVRRMAEHYDEVVRDVDTLVSEIAAIVARCEPVALLKRAWWENAVQSLDAECEADLGPKHLLSQRMLDYVQCVVVSTPTLPEQHEPSDDDWRALTERVEKLFANLTLTYHLVNHARRRSLGEPIVDAVEDFRYRAQVYWLGIRGKRYAAHNEAYFRRLLHPHDTVLRDVVGTGVDGVLALVRDVEHRHTRSVGEAFEALQRLRECVGKEVAADQEDRRSDEDIARARLAAIERLGLSNEFRSVIDRLYGEGVFRLAPVDGISSDLLNCFALAPGADVLTFDYFSLMDNLYRAIERHVVRARPTYRETWNRRQKEVTEAWPVELLERLLPGARVWRGVYYPDPNQAKQWAEVDAVLQYDDALFIVEVKAGAFYRDPPAQNFDRYILKIRDLIEDPVSQAGRFISYIEGVEDGVLYDSAHREIGRVRRAEIGLLVPLAITLDNLTHLAAQSRHLKALDISVGARPAWPIAIEDLLVYADLFTNPLVFLHFVEQRLRASTSEALELADEIDHVGLYVSHNWYVDETAARAADGSHVVWHGYRAPIDKYYRARQCGDESAKPPMQELPELMSRCIENLALKAQPGRRRAASCLLDFAFDARKDLWEGVALSFAGARAGRVRPMTLQGRTHITVTCWHRRACPRDGTFARRHAIAAMLAARARESRLIEISFDGDDAILNVRSLSLRAANLSDVEKEQAERDARDLESKRSRGRGTWQRVGSKSECSCGSGKDFDECHGARRE